MRKKDRTSLPGSFRAQNESRPLAKTTLALGISAVLAGGVYTAQAADVINLDTLSIEDRAIDTNPYAEPGAPYKARVSGDERRQRPLAELPANISVLTGTQIEDSGYTDLRDILDAQPGITLGTGENGNAFGDRYIIRGQEARSDVFVDGLRDPGMTIRESFATEQVEITKGPSSTFVGRGSVGGAVNSVTKMPNPEYDFSKLSVGLGADAYRRLSIDSNHRLSDNAAVRINALHAYEDVPGRDPADRERNGLALSGLLQVNDNLQLVADYYGLRAEDSPDLGGYMVDNVPVDNPPVYVQEEDFLKSDVDVGTLRLEYRINPGVKLTNAMCYGVTENRYVATGARNGTGYPTEADANAETNGFTTTTLSTHQGWQEVDYLANHTNLFFEREIGGYKNEFIFGLELTDHSVLNGVYDYSTNDATANCWTSGRGGISQGHCLTLASDPHNLLQRTVNRGDWDSDWNARAMGISLMDTVELSDTVTVNAGIRHDWTEVELQAYWDHDGDRATPRVLGEFKQKENMWNGHAGVTYKFRPDAMVYASYATAADLNGGESDVGTSAGYGGLIVDDAGNASAKPEHTENIELGTKWNLNGGKLLATAALFQITKSDVMEGDGYDATGSFNTGKNRTRGIEFGLNGNLTDKLSMQAGVTFMNSKVLESVDADNIDQPLSNFAENSAAMQVRYQLTPDFAFGAKARYEGERYVGQPDTAGNTDRPIPSYTAYDLFASYRINKKLSLRLNVENVTDEDYYTAGYRSGSFLFKGDELNANLTMKYEF